MAAKRSKKNRNRKESVTQLPDATPVAIGRSFRLLAANGDGEGLASAIGSLWTRCKAKLNGSDMISEDDYQKGTAWAVLHLDVPRLLSNITTLAREMSDESLGQVITNMIVESVFEDYQAVRGNAISIR